MGHIRASRVRVQDCPILAYRLDILHIATAASCLVQDMPACGLVSSQTGYLVDAAANNSC